MALVERHNWDIGTTAMKGQLEGCQIKTEDGWKTVSDWWIDHATEQINIEFEGEDIAVQYPLKEKFAVKVYDSIKPLKNLIIARMKRI